MSGFKPPGFSTVSPYLVSADANASIAFMENVLGAEINDLHTDPATGRVVHASLVLEDSIIMIGGAMEGWPERPAHVHVYVSDVDASYAKALAFGATSVMEPAQKSSQDDRRAGLLDAGGTTWWLATHTPAGAASA